MRAAFALAAAALSASAVAAQPSCDITVYSGYDLNGGDLPNQPVSKTMSTSAECASACCSTSGCNAFSLNAGSPGTRWCYLKSGGWTNQSIPGVESGSRPPQPPNVDFPWFNASIPQAQRVALLVAAMTVDEQISWLDNSCPAIPRLGLPAYDWEAEALHGVSWNGVATVFPANIGTGASFDVPLMAQMARVVAIEARAKWLAALNPDGSSPEFAGLSFMTPNLNLFISPTWGRGQETVGEDPAHTSAFNAAYVSALQFDDDGTFGNTSYHKVIAVAKHFLAYHLESIGTDGQARLSHSFNVTMTDMQQTYLVPFAAAVDAGVSSVMCAYDGQNWTGPNPYYPNPGGAEPWGIPMCLHPLLQTALRDQLGFQGYVITDEGSITFAGPGYHNYASSVKDAACAALLAGSDLALGGEFGPNLGQCLSEGKITAGRIAEALTRTLTAHFRLGWFDSLAARARGQPDPVPYNTLTVDGNVSTPAHRALSRAAARESFVLLKNDGGNTLPLSASALAGKKVALVGPAAVYDGTATSSYIGSYSGCEAGPGGNLVSDPRCHVVTLLEALTALSNASGFALSFAAGTDINTVNASGIPAAVASAQGAEVILAAVGLDTCQESYCSEGEANDRGRGSDSVAPTLDLPGSQLPLLQALVAAYPTTPIILILLNGGPVSSPYAFNVSSAVLEAWYPGYEGGNAIVDVLFGSYSPAGRLPVTVVNGLEDLPPVTDFVMATPPGRTHRYFTGQPLYPFGFGLSYASFSYSSLSLTPSTLAPSDASFTISATLTHTGGMVSDEVVLLFGAFQQQSQGLASIPLQQLLNFTRVHDVQPGQSVPVSFTVPRSALQLVNATGSVTVSPGQWALFLGGGPPSAVNYPGGAPVLSTTLTVQ